MRFPWCLALALLPLAAPRADGEDIASCVDTRLRKIFEAEPFIFAQKFTYEVPKRDEQGVVGRTLDQAYAQIFSPDAPRGGLTVHLNPQRVQSNTLVRMHKQFLEEVYQTYLAKGEKPEIVQLLRDEEEKLPIYRQEFIGLHYAPKPYGTPGGRNLGISRIYDGTPRPRGRMPNDPADDTILPLERMLQVRGLATQAVKKSRAAVEAGTPKGIIEIGRLNLLAKDHLQAPARTAMYAALADSIHYYQNLYKTKSVEVFAHAPDAAHLRFYQKQFGFELADTITFPDSPRKEYILRIDGQKLAEAFLKQ